MFVDAYIVNAFVDGGIGGNPAGVVLDADRLSREQKQAIAATIGMSETAFVSRSAVAGFKLEFFTPNRQIAHCGHATVATFALLKELGIVSDGMTSKETIDGNRDILIRDNMVFMEQRAPRYLPLSSGQVQVALKALGTDMGKLLKDVEPSIVDTGTAFLIVPLRDERIVANLELDLEAIAYMSERLDLVGLYVFSPQTKASGRIAGARMFAPRYGINEEAATGMAAGQLACFLYDRADIKQETMCIEQGYLMPKPSPSAITVDLDVNDGAIRKLMAGGYAKPIKDFSVAVHPALLGQSSKKLSGHSL